MAGRKVVLIAVVLAFVAATLGSTLARASNSDDEGNGFWFSVITSSTGDFGTGSSIAIFGHGTFEGGDAEGNGVFATFTGAPPPPASHVLASGTWEVTAFGSFDSYGSVAPRSEGGKLILTVEMDFDDGSVVTGVTMTVTCHVGSPPGDAPAEGITLSGPISYGFSKVGITNFGIPPRGDDDQGENSDGGNGFWFGVITSSTGDFGTGTSIAIFGQGIFDGDSVEANGIFLTFTGTPPPPVGHVLASGTWEATRIVSFDSYGAVSPRTEGGKLVLTVNMHFDGGRTIPRVTMTITCHVGSPPGDAPAEGITLSGPISYGFSKVGITNFGAPPG